MELLEAWTLSHCGVPRRIELLHGNLARLPREHAVDVLVVSAFPNDYLSTSTSLIGALARAGLSVAALAKDKGMDARTEFSFWLSRRLPAEFAFRELLCLESGWRGTAPEIVDDLFRALGPLVIIDRPQASVAMPLIGTGDQGWPVETMLTATLRAAVGWIRRGLRLSLLKIVVKSDDVAHKARAVFASMRQEFEIQSPENCRNVSGLRGPGPMPLSAAGGATSVKYDVFLSYAHEQADIARTICDRVTRLNSRARIFVDRNSLRAGESWLLQVAESLDASRRVVALYTPEYWLSNNCKDEFAAGLARQSDTANAVLFPIYFRTAPIPYLFRNLQHHDCREGDVRKLGKACEDLSQTLPPE